MQLSLPFDEPPSTFPDAAANEDCPVTPVAEPREAACANSTAAEFEPGPPAAHASRKKAAAQNFQQVLDGIAADPSKLGGEMRSAIQTLARGIGRKPRDIPTDPATLRVLVTEATPAQVGVTPKRWANVRSLVLKSLATVGVEVMPGRDTGGPDAAWRDWLDRVQDIGDRHGLSRFASYCSKLRIPLEKVTQQVFADFTAELETTSLVRDPTRVVRSTALAWNRAAEVTVGWTEVRFVRPPDLRKYALPADTFPASFHADREAYLAQGGNPDPFADDYSRPMRPDTILVRRRQINQIASALVASGFPASAVTGLAALTEPENARAALQWLRERNGGVFTQGLAGQAHLLHTLAAKWVKNPVHEKILKGYASRHRDPVKRKGMTPKNRERLRQFDLDPNVRALVLLPLRILERARLAKHPSEDFAREVLFALAVEILLVAPIRMKNLTGLEIERHLLEVRRGRKATRHIVISAADTKTGAPYEMELPSTSQRLLAVYLDHYRPLLAPEGSPYLFPGNGLGPRNRSGFGAALSDYILRHTGLKMNPHIFRHLAAKLHLRAYPQQIEVVRLVLSHASTETTDKFYAEQKADHAFRAYDATIASLRAGVDAPVILPTRRQPRRRS